MDLVKNVEKEQLKNDLSDFKAGDAVRVNVRVTEGKRERIQPFHGIVIKRQGGSINETFTVRRIASGVSVERTFLVHSPRIESVDIIRKGKVARGKLYYLRNRIGKAARVKMK